MLSTLSASEHSSAKELDMVKIGTRAASAVVVLVLLAGCSSGGGSMAPEPTSGSSSAATGGSSSAATGGTTDAATITIKDFAYAGAASVAAGTTVTVTNMDAEKHTVTSDDGTAFDVTVEGNMGTATFTVPSAAGTYAYHCKFHANMHGSLDVK
jgi:plastocyanin